MKKWIGIFLVLGFLHAQCPLSQNAQGDYLITNYADLLEMGKGDCSLDQNYRLNANINAAPSAEENCAGTECKGFVPVGTYPTPFTGTLSGAGFTIDSLFIKDTTLANAGLFYRTLGATIDSLTLSNLRFTAKTLGGVTGSCDTSVVHNVTVQGSLAGAYYVGGICGQGKASELYHITSELTLKGIRSTNDGAGGLVGYGDSLHIENATSVFNTTEFYALAGGIGGTLNHSTLKNIHSKPMIAQGFTTIGGVAGLAQGTEIDSFTVSQGFLASNNFTGLVFGSAYHCTLKNGTVSGSVHGTQDLGGVLGLSIHSSLSNILAEDIYSYGDFAIGGLIGKSDSTQLNNLTLRSNATGDSLIGGIIGSGTGDIGTQVQGETSVIGRVSSGGIVGAQKGGSWSHLDLFVSLQINDYTAAKKTGGLVGESRLLTLKNINLETRALGMGYSAGGVWGWDSLSTLDTLTLKTNLNGINKVGGVVGESYYTVVQNADIDFNISGQNDLGGMAGNGNFNAYNSRVTGILNGSQYLGGVVGAGYMGSIEDVFAKVSITGGSYLGGIAGFSYTNLARCTTQVNITGSSHGGGIVGFNFVAIEDIHAKGSITTGQVVGGVIGKNFGSVRRASFNGNILGNVRGGLIGHNEGLLEQGAHFGVLEAKTDTSGTLVGINLSNGAVRDSYNAGVAINANTTSGLFGFNGGVVENVYSAGAIRNLPEEPVIDSLPHLNHNPQIARLNNSLNSLQLGNKTNFTSFNFDTTWVMDVSSDFPRPQLSRVRNSLVAPVRFALSPESFDFQSLLPNGENTFLEVSDYFYGTPSPLDLNSADLSGYESLVYRFAQVNPSSADTTWSNYSLIRFGEEGFEPTTPQSSAQKLFSESSPLNRFNARGQKSSGTSATSVYFKQDGQSDFQGLTQP